MIKSVKIGNYTTENNLFVAPLASFTDFAFREICLSLGAGLVYTEMVSAKALCYNNEKTIEMLYGSAEKTCVQIFGSEPEIMRRACEKKELEKFKIVDINMGCPMPKIYNNGEGSALLNDFALAGKIISECKKSGKIITVKTRLGITKNNPVIEDFAKLCYDSGADAITIHARCKNAIYAGDCDYELVGKVKRSIGIPVIVNGGIFSREDFENAMEISGADGAMLARGAIENPKIIADILGKSSPSVKELLFKQLDLLSSRYNDKTVAVTMRKAINLYLKGVKGAKQKKIAICACESVKEIKNILSDLEF